MAAANKTELGKLDSPVEAAVLALVREQPEHGYGVLRRFEERFGHLLPVLPSRIYKALHSLTDMGWLEEVADERPTRRRRGPVYRLTETGSAAHRNYLLDRFEHDDLSSELHRRILTVSLPDLPALIELVARYEQACLERTKHLHQPVQGMNDSPEGILDTLRARMIADEERLRHDARVMFIEHARKHLLWAMKALAELRP